MHFWSNFLEDVLLFLYLHVIKKQSEEAIFWKTEMYALLFDFNYKDPKLPFWKSEAFYFLSLVFSYTVKKNPLI